ncbi:hypothetical protein LEMLEM_LOCUS24159, partial [Lemmus lemmus]
LEVKFNLPDGKGLSRDKRGFCRVHRSCASSGEMLIKILTSSWLWLLLIRACNIGGTPSQYQLFNFTWQVINKAGDIAYSSSTIASTPPWNPIKV